MKKYLYIAIALFTCALGFTACGDDDGDDSSYVLVGNKGEAVAGTYNGTWTYTDADGNAKTAAGQVILAAGETSDVVLVSFPANADARLNALNGKANIAQQADRFIITNTAAAGNGLTNVDNVQAGYRIFVEGSALVMQFTMEKTGRGGYTHTYKFEGAKPAAE
ncbi:MAG: hypothetical protein IJV13_06390 [Prevotella sp.]|nr:hypothetical protein [Prevotella sp.]